MTPAELEALVDQMTLAEQVSLLAGEDFWSTPAIPRLGIGKLRVTDGPNGARGSGSLVGGVKSACFPCAIALGATWNVPLLGEIAAALADEVKSKGAHMLLAPTINVHRSVTNGRNFECYSEDPLLAAELAAAYIAGLQAKGVAATAKHYAGNESETERTTMSSEIDERTLREVYLMPFEWAVKKAGTWGIMSSYNRLNGTFASEHHWLLTTVPRVEWGYDGIVMSDWFGSHTTAATVNAGLDLEMPGPTRDRGNKLVAAVQGGEVEPRTVRESALRMLRLMDRTGALRDDRSFAERAEDRPEHRALIRRAGADGAVLLKNDGALPLAGKGRIAIIGPNAKTAQIMGGGSAQLNAHYRVSPWEGLVAALGEERLAHAPGCTNHRFEPVIRGSFRAEFFDNREFAGEPVVETHDDATAFWAGRIGGERIDAGNFSARLTGRYTAEASGAHRVGIHSAGFSRIYVDGKLVADAWSDWQKGRTFFEQGCDEVVGTVDLKADRSYEIIIEFANRPGAEMDFAAFSAGIGLPLGDEAMAEAAALAADAEVAILCIGRNGEWDTEGSDLRNIALPGRQDELVAAVARANPNTIVVLQTGGPVEMPWLEEVAAVLEAWYPGQEAGNAIADVLTGAAEPGGRLPQSFPARWSDNPAHSQDPEIYPGLDGKVRYAEGVFIGYRHYDRHGIAPLFPFGFGLGYTTFALSDLAVSDERFEAEGRLDVTLTLANTGGREGVAVVQLYVGDDKASEERPQKELKAFEKVALSAGESRQVSFSLDARAFAFYSVEAGRWLVEPGNFTIRAGLSSTDLPLEAKVSRATALELAV